jgi:hypothetical protein
MTADADLAAEASRAPQTGGALVRELEQRDREAGEALALQRAADETQT